jgi:hypothetical protein
LASATLKNKGMVNNKSMVKVDAFRSRFEVLREGKT